MAGPDDVAALTALLGRPPQADFDVVVRADDGTPIVVRNDPFTADGTPMPTRFWLVDRELSAAVSRLESAGGVRAAAAVVDPVELQAAHDRYAVERNDVIDDAHAGPRPSGGVAGTRVGVKCLHAHYAWYLAGGDDPVGQWVADVLASPTRDFHAWAAPEPGAAS
jgi:hypothetical protein